MNKIEKLIERLCPEGVTHRFLWEVTAWDKRFNAVENHKQTKFHKYTYVLAARLKTLAVDGGDVKLLATGLDSPGWTTREVAGELVSEAEIVAIPWGGKAVVHYFSGPFVTADNRIAQVLNQNELSTKFLYYVLLEKLDLIESFYRGSGIRHPSMKNVLDLRIPVPPLHVQNEIVLILDKFMQLEAELEAELEARSLQNSSYRKSLLSFDSQIKWSTLDEIAEYVNGKAHEKFVSSAGTIPLITARFVSRNGEANRHLLPEDVQTSVNKGDVALVLSDLPNGRALARSFFVDADHAYAINQRVARLRVRDSNFVDPRFMFYYLDRNPDLVKYDNGADQTHLSKSQVTGLRFPVPELAVQREIVRVLDAFDSLLNDISIGLPAEITARRQQYEYYRSKLLTFKELKAS